MDRRGRTTVRHLPAGVRLEHLSEWLNETRLAVVGLRRRRADAIAPHGLPGERLLLLTLEGGGLPASRHGVAAIAIEANDDGDERWARVTAQVDDCSTPVDAGDVRAIARALGAALRTALRDVQAPRRADGA